MTQSKLLRIAFCVELVGGIEQRLNLATPQIRFQLGRVACSDVVCAAQNRAAVFAKRDQQ